MIGANLSHHPPTITADKRIGDWKTTMAHVEWYTMAWPQYAATWTFNSQVGYITRGVYVIWYQGYWGNPVTVRVGRGYISKRLQEHYRDPKV